MSVRFLSHSALPSENKQTWVSHTRTSTPLLAEILFRGTATATTEQKIAGFHPALHWRGRPEVTTFVNNSPPSPGRHLSSLVASRPFPPLPTFLFASFFALRWGCRSLNAFFAVASIFPSNRYSPNTYPCRRSLSTFLSGTDTHTNASNIDSRCSRLQPTSDDQPVHHVPVGKGPDLQRTSPNFASPLSSCLLSPHSGQPTPFCSVTLPLPFFFDLATIYSSSLDPYPDCATSRYSGRWHATSLLARPPIPAQPILPSPLPPALGRLLKWYFTSASFARTIPNRKMPRVCQAHCHNCILSGHLPSHALTLAPRLTILPAGLLSLPFGGLERPLLGTDQHGLRESHQPRDHLGLPR